MKKDIVMMVAANVILLPGELGAGYLMRDASPNCTALTWAGLAAVVGLLFTVNCFIAGYCTET